MIDQQIQYNIYSRDKSYWFFSDEVRYDQEIPNWHEYYEFICIISGEAIYHYNANCFKLKAGDIVCVNPQIVHSTFTDTHFSFHCLILNTTFFDTHSMPVEDLFFQPHIHDDAVFNVFMDLASIFDSNLEYKHAHMIHGILSLLFLLCENYRITSNELAVNVNKTEKIQEAIRYIHANFCMPLSLDDIAVSAGFSKYHFSREFKKYTSYSPFEYINFLRCHEARRLILEGSSISAAAYSCGFANLSNFTKIFKDKMGCLPSSLYNRKSLVHNDLKG